MPEQQITFLSHTAKPGGAELALRRYLMATQLPVKLITMADGEIWTGLPCPVEVAPSHGALAKMLRRSTGPVVANSMRAAFYAALLSPRRRWLIYWVRDGLVDSAMSNSAVALTKNITARRVNHYMANSAWTAETVRHALGTRNVSVVHSMCGVTAAELDRPSRPAPSSPLRLLFLGRISPWKGPDVAVKALRNLKSLGPEAHLTIAGDAHFNEAEYHNTLVQLARKEPNTQMLGHVTDVRSLLESHDMLIHCSTRPEPFGQVIVQALAAAMPVVATAGGGPAEILTTGGGALYTAGSPTALAHAISALAHRKRYAEASAAALHTAARFTDESSIRSLDLLLMNANQTR